MKTLFVLVISLFISFAIVLRPLLRPVASSADWQKATLTFIAKGSPKNDMPFHILVSKIPPQIVSSADHYYDNKLKHYRALPIEALLHEGFSMSDSALRAVDFRLRATDGYEVMIAGTRLLEGGAYIAFDDADVPGWEPIGREHANPGPLYFIWTGTSQQDIGDYPRPWRLRSIEIADFEAIYPHTVPRGEPVGSAASQGFEVFRGQCMRCHSINHEGGHIGPDLNAPQSIVEYRPESQIRAYIRNPRTFRYSNMPPHPNLTDSDLDHLIAYFHTMKSQKHTTKSPMGVPN